MNENTQAALHDSVRQVRLDRPRQQVQPTGTHLFCFLSSMSSCVHPHLDQGPLSRPPPRHSSTPSGHSFLLTQQATLTQPSTQINSMIDSSPDVLTTALAVTPQGWMSVPPAPALPSHPLVTLLFSFAYTTQAARSLHLVAGVFGYCHKNSCQVTCDV